MRTITSSNLQTADQLFVSGNAFEALPFAENAVAERPDSYWARFLLGRIYLSIGRRTKALKELTAAAGSDDPARIGAKFTLAFAMASQNDLNFEATISSAILEADGSEQKRWYFSDLLFLRAMHRAHLGRFEEAERDIRSAYSFRTDIDERKYRFDWVLAATSNPDATKWPNLTYVSRILRAPSSGSVYHNALSALPGEAFILEIGANDGVKTDALYPFITSRNWRALLVEPVSSSFQKLLANYSGCSNVQCAKVAVTRQNGPVTISLVRPESLGKYGLDPSWAEGVSSLDRSGGLRFIDKHLVEEVVEGITFQALSNRYDIRHVDVLQIDTEGHDYIIFQQIDLDRLGIRIVHLEMNNLMPVDRLVILDSLSARGFTLDYDGYDLTGIR